jgi:hypothetical protein
MTVALLTPCRFGSALNVGFDSGACHRRSEISAAAPKNEHVTLRSEKMVHHLDVLEVTLTRWRAVALKDFPFKIHARTVALVFPNVDFSQFTLETTDHFHGMVAPINDMYYLTSDLIYLYRQRSPPSLAVCTHMTLRNSKRTETIGS